METYLTEIFANSTFLILIGLIAGALFFALVGWREASNGHFEGVFYFALAVFFAFAHGLLLSNIPTSVPLSRLAPWVDFWKWEVIFLAPVVIAFYLCFSLFNFFFVRIREALVKAFFGLTLLCYLYMLGPEWATDIKGMMVMAWSGVWFHLELKTAS